MFKKSLSFKKFALLIILVLAAFIRFWGIYHGSFAFTYDVGRDLLAASDILKGKFTLIGQTTGIPGVFYGPWWHCFLALSSFISGGDPRLMVTIMALVGLVNIYLAYLLGGLVFASLVAFSPHFIGTSVQIWNPNLVPFFLLLSFLIIKKLIKEKNPLLFKEKLCLFFVLGLLTMLTFEMQSAFGVFYLLGVIIGLLVFLRRKEILFFLIGIFLVETPRILFELRHNFLQTKALMNFFTKTNTVSMNLGEKVLNRAGLFWEEWRASLGAGNSLLALLVFLISAYLLLKNLKKFNQTETYLLKMIVLVMATLFLGFVLYPQTIWSYYLVGLPTLYLLIFSLIFNKSLQNTAYRWVFWTGFVVLVLLNVNLPGLWAGFKNPNFAGDAAVYRNQIAVIDYIYLDAKGQKFNVVAYTPPLIEYTWRYHFLWYGQKRYGYQPSKEKQPLFYLVEEPDFETPQRLVDWIQQRKGDGEVINRKEVAGGIIVEKREH